MTENENSPENLRKFLDSDDPALVHMGLSMAKGTESPEDYQHTLLQTLQRHEPEIAQIGARLAIEIGIGDEALDLLCSKEEMNGSGDEIESMGDILAEFGEMAVEPVINAIEYSEDEYWAIGGLISILDRLGGQRALSALIDMLGDECERLIEWNYDHNFPNDNNVFYHVDIMTGIDNTWIQSEENIEHLRLSFTDIWNEENFYYLITTMKDMREGYTGESWDPDFFPLEAAKILTRKGWKPKTDEEKIDYWAVVIASEYLESIWTRTNSSSVMSFSELGIVPPVSNGIYRIEDRKLDGSSIIKWGEEAIDPLIERIDDGIMFVSKALAKLTEELIKTDGENNVKKNILELLEITDLDDPPWDIDWSGEVRETSEYERVKKGANLLKGILEE